MKLAIMQPYIFPYIGYFQLINAVDKFVFYDDVHFIKKGWIHRNKILINSKASLFTIPCKKISQNKLINEVNHNFNKKEKEIFLKTIEFAYKKAPYYNIFAPLLHKFICDDDSKYILTLATNSVQFICDYLGINTQLEYSSKNHSDSLGMEKQARLLDIVKKEGANIYINAIGGKELYDKLKFKDIGVELQFLEPKNINYIQKTSSFVPWLSIIDMIMYNNIDEINKMLLQYNLK